MLNKKQKSLILFSYPILTEIIAHNECLILSTKCFENLAKIFSLESSLEFPLRAKNNFCMLLSRLIVCFFDKIAFFNWNYDMLSKNFIYFFPSDVREINFLKELPSYTMLRILTLDLNSEKMSKIFFIFLAVSNKKKTDNGVWLVNSVDFKNNLENQCLVISFFLFINYSEDSSKIFFEDQPNEHNLLLTKKFSESLIILFNYLSDEDKKCRYGFVEIVEKLLIESNIIVEVIRDENDCFYYAINSDLNEFFSKFSEKKFL